MMKRLLAIAALAFVVLVAGGAAADTFAVTVVSQTSSTITLGWTPQPGYGYLFSADGVLVSRTNNPSRSQVKFSKNSANSYDIDVIVKGANGHCCTLTPPPPPKNQCEDGVDNDGDGKIDYPSDPGCSSATDNDETDSPPPPPASLYVSASGNDAASCTQAAPCRSFNRAYQLAGLGTTVSVAAGTYPLQTMLASSGKGTVGDSPDVTFVAAGTVTVQGLQVGVRGGTNGASHFVIDGNGTTTIAGEINTFLPNASSPPSDITIANLKVTQVSASSGAGIYIRGADRVTFRNVEIGPFCCGDDGMQVNYTDGFATNRDVTNFTLDGVYMHDIVRNCSDLPSPMSGCSSQPSAHTDCIQWWSGVNVTIRNSRFYNCSTSTWLIQDEFGGRFANWTVENNMLGLSMEDASNVFRFACGGACLSGYVHLRHNTLGNNLLIDGPAQASGLDVRVEGNLINSQGSCFGTYVDNVVTEQACPGDILVSSIGVVKLQAPGTDLHLTAASAAIDRIPCHLPVDIDGQARPRGAACDAGADER